MAVIIKEQEIDVDIAEELEDYIDSHFVKAQVRGIKLQACSPFRHEGTPSFAVNLDNGTWIDSGAVDDEWRKGNFVKLLSFLMGVTYGEAEEFLLEKYRTIYADVDNLELKINLEPEPQSTKIVTQEELEPYFFRHPYLEGRGVNEKVQRAFKVGYDTKHQAIVLPHMDRQGNVVNLKFRSVNDKKFYYLPDGQPIKSHVYGLNFIHRMDKKTAFVVESEIDALYLWSHELPAIALSSASMSKQQEKLILSSPIERLVLAFDNDKAGYRCKMDCIRRLQGCVELWELPMPNGCKDVNDIPAEQLREATKRAKVIMPAFL